MTGELGASTLAKPRGVQGQWGLDKNLTNYPSPIADYHTQRSHIIDTLCLRQIPEIIKIK
jgi:hypothetical protein